MPRYRKPADLAQDVAAAKRGALDAAECLELYLSDLRKKPPAPSVTKRMTGRRLGVPDARKPAKTP